MAVLEEKTKIYLVEKNIKHFACCIRDKLYQMCEKDFMDTLNSKCRNLESMGKYAMYYKMKKHYKAEKYLHSINNNVLRIHITGIRCASNLMPVNLEKI